ncbi:PF04536 family protein [Leptospira interrogans serovar Canicola]|nr:PF04536 family protein [Leptospira interrogans serovar Canicola]
MIPHFKNGDYFQGVSDGIDTLILKIDGEELPETNKIPKFFEVINKYSMYIFPSLILVILIITIFITSGIFGTIVLIGGGFFLILNVRIHNIVSYHFLSIDLFLFNGIAFKKENTNTTKIFYNAHKLGLYYNRRFYYIRNR